MENPALSQTDSESEDAEDPFEIINISVRASSFSKFIFANFALDWK